MRVFKLGPLRIKLTPSTYTRFGIFREPSLKIEISLFEKD